jgi:hypothetical protein
MPEKSRGVKRSSAKGGRITEDSVSKKNVSFEVEQMDLDERFEELSRPIYKGKRLDDPIPSPVVRFAYKLRVCLTAG